MLRLALLTLLLANAGYFAWSQGLLTAWGLAPAQQSEPQRVEQQIRPESLRVLSAGEPRTREPVPLLSDVASQPGPRKDSAALPPTERTLP